MRRAAVATLMVVTAWLAMASPASASQCGTPFDPSLDSFAYGTPYGWGRPSQSHAVYLVIGSVSGLGPDRFTVDVIAVVGRDEAADQVTIHSSPWGLDLGETYAFQVMKVERQLERTFCGWTTTLDDPIRTVGELEQIALGVGTPFARPAAIPESPWAQSFLVGSTIVIVGVLDQQRRRMLAHAV